MARTVTSISTSSKSSSDANQSNKELPVHKMVKPLTFKGDKPKKRKARDTDPTNPSKSRKTTAAEEDQPRDQDASTNPPSDQSWVSADTPSDIAGPVVLVLPAEEPICLASDANGKVFASGLENLIDGEISTAEPHDVRQVWVASRVAGMDGFSFKGAHGKYVLGSSEFDRLFNLDTDCGHWD